MAEQQTVSRLLVAHLVGGQTFIGSVEQLLIDGKIMQPNAAVMQRPYEIFVLPPERGNESTITMIKFGTLLGMVPSLGVEYADLSNKVLAFGKPGPREIEAYQRALELERNPPTKEQVAQMLRPGQASSSEEK